MYFLPETLTDFYVHQVISSVNYPCGNDVTDFFHGWLNYQIEHHLFPDLPLIKYREIQPAVQLLCTKYNIPYKQENVFVRMQKTMDVIVGKNSMRRL